MLRTLKRGSVSPLPSHSPHSPSSISSCELSHSSHVQLSATLWTVARQAPLSMGFSRQGYWSGLPCPPPGALPDPGIKPMSLKSPALAGGSFTTSATGEAQAFQYSAFPAVEVASLHVKHTRMFCMLISV